MKVLVVFYSLYGHIYELAKAIAEGAQSVEGSEIALRRVPETLSEEALTKMKALEHQQKLAKEIPECTVEELGQADIIFFGTPTRFGNMCGQMRQFLDRTGKLWMQGSLVGKVGSVFTSSSTQHGGQETTLLTFYTNLLHQGMVVAGLPYTFAGQSKIDEITGCSPYGASTITGPNNERDVSENEREGARFQGKYVTELGAKLRK